MTIELDYCPRQKQGITKSIIDGHAVLLNDQNEQALVLNASSHIIWELCDGATSITQMIASLQTAFPEAQAQIPTDVISALRAMKQADVVR